MIKRSANKQGVVTFNIHFQHLQHPNKCSPNIDTTNASLYQTDQSHASLLSYRSNPLTPLDHEDQNKALRHESRSISSDVDSFNIDEAQTFEEAHARAFQHSHTNDENISRAVTEDFMTQEPIDFEGNLSSYNVFSYPYADLQRVTGIERDDEDKSSAASTLSKGSKKISKPKTGHVYKESRFKEEARNKTKRQAWQPHEDEQVLDLVTKHGQSWALIASMMEGRTGKQIRDRYLNKLKPDIKNEEWTREEDKLLITLFKTIGRKWSKIATHLQGRTEGQVKNRFYSHLQKKVLPTDQIGYASASPEGEMSPASKVDEIVNRKAASERKFFKDVVHNNSGYKLDKNSFRQQMSNLDTNFDFQEQKGLYEGGFQYPEVYQEMSEGRVHSGLIDPTDVISYNETSNSDRKSLSPEKYPGKNNFVTKISQNNNQGFFLKEMNPVYFMGSQQETSGFSDLAHEFKARCNTENLNKRSFSNEAGYQDRSPLQGVDQFINKDAYTDNRMQYNYKPIMGGYDFLRERPSEERYSRENMFRNTQGMNAMNPSNSSNPSYQYQKESSNMF